MLLAISTDAQQIYDLLKNSQQASVMLGAIAEESPASLGIACFE